jgi:hypothetical protein
MLNWDAIGAVGEVLGAIAVVTTLLYLASQTKHTRLAVESAGNLGTAEAHSRFRQALMTNPQLAALLAKANENPNVTEAERIQLQMLFFDVFIACVIGFTTQSTTDVQRTDVIFLAEFLNENPYGKIEWERRRNQMELLVPEFCNEVDKLLTVQRDD